MKFKINRHKLIILVITTVLSYSVFALYYYFLRDNIILLPAVNVTLQDPLTATKLKQELFEANTYPTLKPQAKRKNINRDVQNMQSAAGKNFDSIYMELFNASFDNTWECDIENNETVSVPLIPHGYLKLKYHMRSYNTGITIEGLNATVDGKEVNLKSGINYEHGYSSGLFVHPFHRVFLAMIKLPEGPTENMQFSGFKLGVWSNFDANRLRHSTIEITNIWKKTGKPVIDPALQKMNIHLLIKRLQYVDESNKRFVDIEYEIPYYKNVKFEIKQGSRIFSFPSKHYMISGKGVYRLGERFDFNLNSTLTLKVEGWEPVETRSVRLLKPKGD